MSRSMPKINDTMVAFIDMLGFKQRLYAAKSDQDLQDLYVDVLRVHDEFEKGPSESGKIASQQAVSRKVIALSDALVVSMDFKSDVAETIGIFDTLACEISEIALRHANCIAAGIFLRGGLARGYHFWDDPGDVLLSSAMAKAYDAENHACYPIIAVDEGFYRWFVCHPGNDAYAEDISPRNNFFMQIVHPGSGKTIHCLDHFHLALPWYDDWYCRADLESWKAEKSDKRKNRILNSSYRRNQLGFVKAHRNAIKAKLKERHSRAARAKYLWLKDYHNRSVDDHGYSARYKI